MIALNALKSFATLTFVMTSFMASTAVRAEEMSQSIKGTHHCTLFTYVEMDQDCNLGGCWTIDKPAYFKVDVSDETDDRFLFEEEHAYNPEANRAFVEEIKKRFSDICADYSGFENY